MDISAFVPLQDLGSRRVARLAIQCRVPHPCRASPGKGGTHKHPVLHILSARGAEAKDLLFPVRLPSSNQTEIEPGAPGLASETWDCRVLSTVPMKKTGRPRLQPWHQNQLGSCNKNINQGLVKGHDFSHAANAADTSSRGASMAPSVSTPKHLFTIPQSWSRQSGSHELIRPPVAIGKRVYRE